MIAFKTFVLWLHLLAVIIWIGGYFFILFSMLTGFSKKSPSPALLSKLASTIGKRFSTLSWEMVGVIVLTGVFNLLLTGVQRSFAYGSGYLSLFGLKIFIIILILLIQFAFSQKFIPQFMALAPDGSSISEERQIEFNALYDKVRILLILLLCFAAAALYIGLQLKTVA